MDGIACVLNMEGSKGACRCTREDCTPTLTKGKGSVNDVHVVARVRSVCVMVDPLAANSMRSANPRSGFHREEYAPCLDTSSQNPVRNGGGMVIVQSRGGLR